MGEDKELWWKMHTQSGLTYHQEHLRDPILDPCCF